MEIDYCAVDTFDLDPLAEMLNRCFAGYLFPVHLDRRTLLRVNREDSVGLTASVATGHADETIGVALVARRGWNCPLAATSIDPHFCGQQVGTSLIEFLLRAARARCDRFFILEVIEQTAPALRRYQAAGFAPVRRLVGYRADAIEAKEDTALEEIDPVEAALAVSRWGVENLPWQISPHALTALGPPHRAFRLGPASARMSDPAAEKVNLCSRLVESAARWQGWAERLLRALSARFPGSDGGSRFWCRTRFSRHFSFDPAFARKV